MTLKLEYPSCLAQRHSPFECGLRLLVLFLDADLPLSEPLRVSGEYFAEKCHQRWYSSFLLKIPSGMQSIYETCNELRLRPKVILLHEGADIVPRFNDGRLLGGYGTCRCSPRSRKL